MQRQIRSFVRRDSRITAAQKASLAQHGKRYILSDATNAASIRSAFQSRGPLALEIGCGDGACLIDIAQRERYKNFLGVEVYKPGLGRLMNEAHLHRLSNIRLFDNDVCQLLDAIDEPVFSQVFIFFPDPWPKKRHHKRRLLNREFLTLLRPAVHRHARVFIATDDLDYAENIVLAVADSEQWINLGDQRGRSPRPKFRIITRFEQRAITAPRAIHEFVIAPC